MRKNERKKANEKNTPSDWSETIFGVNVVHTYAQSTPA